MSGLKRYVVVLLWTSLLSSFSVFAQKQSVAMKADEAFDQRQYVKAIELYEKAYDKVKSNRLERNRIVFQMGESYRQMGNYSKAINLYKRLIKAKYYLSEPKIYFYLAEAYRFSADSEQAKENYEAYLKLKPEDKLAQLRLSSLLDFDLMLSEKTRHVIIPMENINTGFNEWSPQFLGTDTNILTFTSSRVEGKETPLDSWTGQAYSDIYQISKDRNGKWLEAEPYDKELINSPYNEGEACFSPDGNTAYFSRCVMEKGKNIGCAIYVTSKAVAKGKTKKKQESGSWSEPSRVELGDSTYNYLHPMISSDGLSLYFSSDMPGGEGDYDIWIVKRTSIDDAFGKPENLGNTINTASKEAYPTLKNDSTLCFSSAGRAGLGGLDLFETQYIDSEWTAARNLGYPINTTYDEIGIVYYPENSSSSIEERGYFSSNRPVSEPHSKNAMRDLKRKKQKEINDNIWYFELPALQYSIEGIVKDDKSMQPIPGAKIRLVGSDGTTKEVYSDKKGFYKFGSEFIKRNQIYKLFVSKVDYFSLEASESTKGYNTDKQIIRPFKLLPIPDQAVVLPEIRFDLSKWQLTEIYKDSLLDLYTILVNNPNIVIEIRSHTDCRPYIGLTNDSLSQRRAQSVIDYLIARGIEPSRLFAKGYGDRVPRKIEKDMDVEANGKVFHFKKSQVLDCEYISFMKSKEEQEAAHTLNRRTEFFILRTDFVSKKLVDNFVLDKPKTEQEKIIDLVTAPKEDSLKPPQIIYDESIIPLVMIQSTKGEVMAIVNGAQISLLIDELYKDVIAFSWEEAMNFIYQKRINKDDFPERENAFDPDGNILDKSLLVLKNVKIGTHQVENLEVIVVKNLPHKMIMNKNGLKLFGPYEFDKQKGQLRFLEK